jgi:hypothetical protein
VDQCSFARISRPGYPPEKASDPQAQKIDPFDIHTGVGMPGAIDCEPNNDGFPILRNVLVKSCNFVDGGGAAVALLLQANHRLRTAHRNFQIRDCVVEGQRVGFTFFAHAGEDAKGLGPEYDVIIENNRLTGGDSPFIISGARGLSVVGNTFSDYALSAELGYNSYNSKVALTGNSFIRVGYSTNGVNGLLVRYADNIVVSENRFIDCGRADKSGGRAIYFAAGEIKHLRLERNQFDSPTGRTTYAIGIGEAKLDRTSSAADNVYSFAGGRDFG